MPPNINQLLRANPASCSRGAPMGDSGFIKPDQPLTGLLCQRITLVDGDYGPDGTYWGYVPREHMYAVFNGANAEYKPARGLLKFYRATSRHGAIAQFHAQYPEYNFARGPK